MTDIEGISEGRKQVALEKADEARREWMRAERAEAEVARLRAALREVMDDLTLIGKNNWLPVGLLDDVIYVNARAAPEEART